MPKLTGQQAANVSDAEEQDDFLVHDPGVYALQLNDVRVGNGKQGTYWTWEFLITHNEDGQEFAKKTMVWEITSLSEKAAWRMKRMFEAFGVAPDTDTDELLGQSIWATLEVKIAEGGRRQGKPVNVFGQPLAADE